LQNIFIFILNKEKHDFSVNDARLSSLNYKNCNFGC